MPMTRLWMEELGMKHMALDPYQKDVVNILREDYRGHQISRAAFVEQLTAFCVEQNIYWLCAEADAYRIDTEDDYDRTPDT